MAVYGSIYDSQLEMSVDELQNANTDRTVNPVTMVRGIMGRDAAGTWQYAFVSAANRYLMVSGTFTSTGVSANQSLSALLLGGTAFIGDVSALSPDAAFFRVSAIGGTAGDRTIVDGTTQTISATLTPISAAPAGSVAGLVTNDFQSDANKLHTSAFVDSGSVSAKSADANQVHVSAVQGDGGLFRVSAVNFPLTISGTVSAFINQGTVSAYSPDASLFRVSAIQAAGLSSSGAQNFIVSAKNGDAGTLRVSSWFGVDTTGQWSIGRLSNLSSSGNIKSTAGTVYGYYAYNSDKIPNYINFTNTSGAINVGTDTVVLKIMLPPSAAANVGFPGGLAGFTAGIGAYGTSAIADNATTPNVTSAVGINVFFN